MNFALVFEQGDFVLISAFLILVIMSITTWSIILYRSITLISAKRKNRQAENMIWQSANLESAKKMAQMHPSPISELTIKAIDGLAQYENGEGGLASSLPLSDYLTRNIRNNLHKITRRYDGGLTTIASVGATAPFVGLFGTVWGIYHALINISHSGQMSIAAVAGPIGEALVATAAGLFVAIPAVLAYNALVRSNKTLSQSMDAFAHDLYIQLLKKGL